MTIGNLNPYFRTLQNYNLNNSGYINGNIVNGQNYNNYNTGTQLFNNNSGVQFIGNNFNQVPQFKPLQSNPIPSSNSSLNSLSYNIQTPGVSPGISPAPEPEKYYDVKVLGQGVNSGKAIKLTAKEIEALNLVLEDGAKVNFDSKKLKSPEEISKELNARGIKAEAAFSEELNGTQRLAIQIKHADGSTTKIFDTDGNGALNKEDFDFNTALKQVNDDLLKAFEEKNKAKVENVVTDTPINNVRNTAQPINQYQQVPNNVLYPQLHAPIGNYNQVNKPNTNIGPDYMNIGPQFPGFTQPQFMTNMPQMYYTQPNQANNTRSNMPGAFGNNQANIMNLIQQILQMFMQMFQKSAY